MILLSYKHVLALVIIFEVVNESILVSSRASMLPKLSSMKKDECLKTSHYVYDENDFLCRDLDKCYKYFCYDTSQRCSICLPPPCHNEEEKQPIEYKPLDVDDLNPILLTIEVGHTQCLGSVVQALYPGLMDDPRVTGSVVVTSANCLSGLQIECSTEEANNTEACFMQESEKITKVVKGFRSYFATLTFKDRKIRIPLNSQNVLISRQYMECGDCQYGAAVIRLSIENIAALRIQTKLERFLEISPSQAMDEQEGLGAAIYGKQGKKDFISMSGILNGIWKKKMCISVERNESFTAIGSPVITRSNEGTLLATGVITHLVEDNEQIQYSIARFDSSFLSFVSAWLNSNWDTKINSREYSKLYSKFDCYPPYPTAHLNESLCLCSIGWQNERNSCKTAFEENMDFCKWNRTLSTAQCNDRVLSRLSQFQNKSTPENMRLIDLLVLPGNIKHLFLTSTNIESIEELSEILRHLDMIQELSLADNNISITIPSSFKYARKLKVLSLARNHISLLHTDTFRRSKRLIKLVLNNNEIPFIKSGTFRKLKSVQNLDLRNNRIAKLHERSFRKNIKLQHLFLSYNNLEELPKNLFKTNKQLIDFRVDHNRISYLHPSIFSGCINLRFLQLNGNLLVKMPRLIFHRLIKLRRVILSQNQLTKLPNNLFERNRLLRTATFRDNQKLPYELTHSVFTKSSMKRLRDYLGKFGTSK